MIRDLLRMRTLSVLSILLVLMMLPTTLVRADEVPVPQALMIDATDRMLQALKDNEEPLKEDPSIIYGLVTEILMPSFDFNKISKLALGKNWRKASESQRERFTEEFRLLLIRTYSTAMLEYADEEIRFLPFRGDVSKKKVKVAMEILQSGGPSIPMAFSMYLNKEEAWKIYDVKIDGISLVTNYRTTFSTRIRNKGMDKLIDSLASKNQKVKDA
ncbi:MAG: ABC transporter substrate-binding protein [Piscirickettsiaceae bacterium]|nr:ABC transporter substrate-binding protein [Piscirickettsiaceae bacterium]